MVFAGVSNQEKENLKTEQMGAFSGYIRRPQPSVSGMTAQIFGEDGAAKLLAINPTTLISKLKKLGIRY